MRYKVVKMKKDKSAPIRYQRAGWMPFDTMHERHGQIWPTKAEAKTEAQLMEQWSSCHSLLVTTIGSLN